MRHYPADYFLGGNRQDYADGSRPGLFGFAESFCRRGKGMQVASDYQ
jgi:hypothetical protein